MKVMINGANKPAPFLGALIGGIVNAGVGGANIALQKELQQKQMAHDKDMAGINQQNILDQMEQQEQYNIAAYERQVEQWNRENEYNDPSQVAARYRAAGISPQAAMGGAASGAGISGGLSSSPSGASGSSTGHASSLPGYGLGGLSSLGTDAVMAANQAEANKIARERMEAENKLVQEKTIGEKFKNDVLNPILAQLQSNLAEKGATENEILKIEATFKPILLSLEAAAKSTSISKLNAEIARVYSQIKNDESYRKLNEKQQQQVEALTRKAQAETYRTWLESHRTELLLPLEQQSARLDLALKRAEKGHKEALIKEIEAQAELLAAKVGLTEQQTNAVKNDVARKWAEFGVDAAHRTSHEIREWLFGWVPFRQSAYNFEQQVDNDRYGGAF